MKLRRHISPSPMEISRVIVDTLSLTGNTTFGYTQDIAKINEFDLIHDLVSIKSCKSSERAYLEGRGIYKNIVGFHVAMRDA